MLNSILIDAPAFITSSRLDARIPCSGDGGVIYDAIIESLEQLNLFSASLPWAMGAQSREISETFCRNSFANFHLRRDFSFLVFDRESGDFIGCVGLHKVNWSVPKCEIGFWCRTSKAGKGYMQEAVHALCRFAFDHFNASRIEIVTDDLNTRAIRLAERCNFQHEGTLFCERRGADGVLRNTRIYSLLRSDVEAADPEIAS